MTSPDFRVMCQVPRSAALSALLATNPALGEAASCADVTSGKGSAWTVSTWAYRGGSGIQAALLAVIAANPGNPQVGAVQSIKALMDASYALAIQTAV